MTAFIIIAVLLLLVGLCIRNLVREHKNNVLCECSGDCENCKIRCQNNEKYYGILRDADGKKIN